MKHETNIKDPRPVQDWENRAVKGAALVGKSIYEDSQNEAMALRLRQEAYEQSLPGEPIEGLNEIYRLLPCPGEIDGPHYAPRAALEMIQELSVNNGLDDSHQIRDALYWLTCQALEGLTSMENRVQKSRDIARKCLPQHAPFVA